MRRSAGVLLGFGVVAALGSGVALAENSGEEIPYSWDCSDTGDWPGADSAVFTVYDSLGDPVPDSSATWGDLDSSVFESVVWSDELIDAGDYSWDVRCYAGVEDLGVNNSASFTLSPVGVPWSQVFGDFLDAVLHFVMTYGVPVLFALIVLGVLVRAGIRFARRSGVVT